MTGQGRLWAGHNPASSWAAVTMLLLALALGVTGFLMANGSAGESFEDRHELLANAFIVVVVLHVAGVILHTLENYYTVAWSLYHFVKYLETFFFTEFKNFELIFKKQF